MSNIQKLKVVGDSTFVKEVTAQDGLIATGGDIVISEGVLMFEDFVDGTVKGRNGATGYKWVSCSSDTFGILNNGICYDFGTLTAALDLSKVRFSRTSDIVQTCEVWFTTGDDPYSLIVPPTTDMYWIDSATGAAPTLLANKHYRLVLRQEPTKIIASVAYLY